MIGYVIAWTCPAMVPVDTLRAALRAGNLPADLAPDLPAVSVLARTAHRMARDHSNTNGDNTLSRRVNTTTRQLTRETSAGDRLDYTRETRLSLDAAKNVTADDATWQHETTRAQSEATTTRTANDVTRLIQRLIESRASDLIPIRAQGGAYFVPQADQALIDTVDKLLAAIGGSLTQFACTLGHGTQESVAETVAQYMMAQIRELNEAIADVSATSRSDVKARRIADIGRLRSKLSRYGTLLGAVGSRVSDAITATDATLTAKLAQGVV